MKPHELVPSVRAGPRRDKGVAIVQRWIAFAHTLPSGAAGAGKSRKTDASLVVSDLEQLLAEILPGEEPIESGRCVLEPGLDVFPVPDRARLHPLK